MGVLVWKNMYNLGFRFQTHSKRVLYGDREHRGFGARMNLSLHARWIQRGPNEVRTRSERGANEVRTRKRCERGANEVRTRSNGTCSELTFFPFPSFPFPSFFFPSLSFPFCLSFSFLYLLSSFLSCLWCPFLSFFPYLPLPYCSFLVVPLLALFVLFFPVFSSSCTFWPFPSFFPCSYFVLRFFPFLRFPFPFLVFLFFPFYLVLSFRSFFLPLSLLAFFLIVFLSELDCVFFLYCDIDVSANAIKWLFPRTCMAVGATFPGASPYLIATYPWSRSNFNSVRWLHEAP